MKNNWKLLIALIVFALVSVAFTWPVILSLGTKMYAMPGDSYGTLYSFWLSKTQPMNYLFPNQAVLVFIGKYLSIAFGEVRAYNLIVLFQFVFSAVPFYLLVRKYTKNEVAAILSGLLVMLAPYRMARALQHMNLADIGFIGFFIYFLLKSDEKPSILNFLLTALVFVLGTLESFQYGLFMGAIFFSFVVAKFLVKLFGRSMNQTRVKSVAWGSVVAIGAFLVLALFAKNFFFDFKQVNGGGQAVSAPVRKQAELNTYSAFGYYYLYPSPDNPFFKPFTHGKYYEQIKDLGTNLIEQTVYLGYLSIILTLVFGFFFVVKKKTRKVAVFDVVFLLVVGLLGFIVSYSADWRIGSHSLSSPAIFIFKYLPFFRVYTRLGILTMASLAIFAGLGFNYLFVKLRDTRTKVAFSILVFCILIIEFAYFPAGRVLGVDQSSAPAVYQWLAGQPGQMNVIEYPFITNDSSRGYSYLLWRRIHQKELLNADATITTQDTYTVLKDIASTSTIARLKDLQVRYIIVHEGEYGFEHVTELGYYTYGDLPKIDSTQLRQVIRFGSDVVYELR